MNSPAELARRLDNLIRPGTIAEVDHARALCRVRSGDLLTDWLPWFERRTGTTRTWNPPTVGEQVVLLCPSGDLAAAMVLTGIYRAAHDQPDVRADTHVTEYPDGARIAYNHASGALTVTGIQTATIEAAVRVTIDVPHTHITGTLTVDDLLTYGNGLTGEGGEHGNAIRGNFTHIIGNLSSNGIVLHTHTHTGVEPGDGRTGGPQ